MVSLKAFLSLENSFATTAAAGWRPMATELTKTLLPLIRGWHWDQAYAVVARVTLDKIVSDQRKRLEELAVSALLFGAHNNAGSLTDTSFVKGTQAIPPALHHALDQLTAMVEVGGTQAVHTALNAFIRSKQVPKIKKADDDEDGEENDLDLSAAGAAVAGVAGDLAGAEVSEGEVASAVAGAGDLSISLGANLTTSRLVSLGYLAEAMTTETTTYEVCEELDLRTCTVCLYMHGKTFSVVEEYSRLLTLLGTSDPNGLRSLAPWPKNTNAGYANLNGMTLSGMQAEGYGSPPYHPGCRGILTNVDTVVEDIPLGQIPIDASALVVHI